MRAIRIGLLVGMLTCVSAAQAYESSLEGKWVTTNPQTRGLTAILVSRDGPDTTVQAWGRCHPRDCNWGVTKLVAVGDSVEDFGFDRGFAIWNAGFAEKYVNLSLHGEMLRIETTTVFKDRSRRANFRSVETMRRATETVP